MRLLIYGINYAPEITGVGKYTADMAEALAAQGHEVRIVTAYPYYPSWKIQAGYSPWRYSKEFLRGVNVWRCPLWIPHQPSGFKRILHLASFAISSLPLSIWQGLTCQPDAVFVVEPTFLCVVGGLLTARLNGAKAWLHVQDFEIDAGFDLELLPSSSFIRSVVAAVEQWLMKNFDSISTISERMMARLKMKGIPISKCTYFPNWVDTQKIYPLENSIPLREELALPSGSFIALYSGSMAEKQGLEILLAVANLLVSDYPNIVFVLCGEGSAKQRLVQLSQKLPNVCFLNLQPVEKLNALLNLADLHLLPQIPNAADLVMPSKLQGMLASGRPVIATARPDTQIASVVQQCGIVVSPGDITAIAKAITYLATDVEKRTRLGKQARRYAVEHWDRHKVLGQLEQKLMELCFAPTLAEIDANAATVEPSPKSGITKLNMTKLKRFVTRVTQTF